MSGASLSVPGLLYVGTSTEREPAVLHLGATAGWVALKGLHTWSREISVVLKADVSESVCRKLGVTLPEAHPEAANLAHARNAARASRLVAVEASLVDKLTAEGVRVHTIGSDRITGGFYYFAKGGPRAAVRVQGNLVEMIAPALAQSADNAALEACLDGVIDRVLAELSEGVLSEAQIELAGSLPSLGEPASEAAAKLQTLEGYLVLTGNRASKYEERAREVVEALGKATRQGAESVHVALFGDARRVVQPELEIEYAEGESGAPRKAMLPERSRWVVTGLLTETMPPPSVVSEAEEAKAAEEKAAATKAAAEKLAAAKAAAEKRAKEKAAAEKAAAERVAAEKAATEKAAEKAAADKAAAEKAAAEKAAAEKAAAEKAAEEPAPKSPAAEKKVTPAKKAPAEVASPKKAGERAQPRPLATRAESKSADKPTPLWVWLALLLVAAAGAYYFFFRGHG